MSGVGVLSYRKVKDWIDRLLRIIDSLVLEVIEAAPRSNLTYQDCQRWPEIGPDALNGRNI